MKERFTKKLLLKRGNIMKRRRNIYPKSHYNLRIRINYNLSVLFLKKKIKFTKNLLTLPTPP